MCISSFHSGFVGEKNRQSPQTQLCGIAITQKSPSDSAPKGISIMAIPHKSARESDEIFFVIKRCKTAGILCVLQGFTNAFLAEKSPRGPHQSPTKYPQGVCRIRSAAKLLTAALWGLVGKGGTAKRLNFCPLKGKMKDTKLVPTQSEDAFVRCCLR